MTETAKIDSWWWFVCKNLWLPLLVGVLILLGYAVSNPFPSEIPGIWEWFERLLAFITFGIALVLWYNQKKSEWIDYLPNRLTVRFYQEGKEVMRCEKAHLSNESDIRALAQQLGMQMCKSQLTFEASRVEILPYEVDNKNRYLHYQAAIHLTELPAKLQGKQTVWVWRENDGTWTMEDEPLHLTT